MIDERWFEPGAVVPVDPQTTGDLVKEVERLREWHKQRNSYTEHPAQDLSKYRCYERMPIQIHHGACIQIVLWKRNSGGLEDIWLHDHNDLLRAHHDLYKRAAEQFHKQLEGHDCIAFWQALRDVANTEIEKWEMAKASNNDG